MEVSVHTVNCTRIDGKSSVNSGIVPPSAGLGATWKLSPSDSQALGEVVGIEYP